MLPFRNLSGDPAEDYVSGRDRRGAAGNAEPGWRARGGGRNLVRPRGQNIIEPARDCLGAGRQLVSSSGSVRRETDKVRVAAQIVDGSTGFDKWSQTFDRKLDDILAVQSEIAAFVTDALLSGIAASRRRRATRRGGRATAPPSTPICAALAMCNEAGRARHRRLRRPRPVQASGRARPQLRRGSGGAVAQQYGDRQGLCLPGGELKGYYSKRAEEARPDAAIRIAPGFADGYSALGFAILNGRLNGRAAAIPYQRSFELGFGSAAILIAYASFASADGALSPRGGPRSLAHSGSTRSTRRCSASPVFLNFDARDYDAAATALNTALSLNPKSDATIHARRLAILALVRGDPAAAQIPIRAGTKSDDAAVRAGNRRHETVPCMPPTPRRKWRS